MFGEKTRRDNRIPRRQDLPADPSPQWGGLPPESSPSYSDQLQEFLDSACDEDRGYIVKLYRKYGPEHRWSEKYLITFPPNYIPDERDLLKYGAGMYRLICRYYDRESGRRVPISRVIEIDPDAVMYADGAPSNGMGRLAGGNDQVGQIMALQQSQTMQMMELFKAVFAALGAGNDKNGSIERVQESISQALIGSFERQQKLIESVSARQIRQATQTEEPEQSDNPLFDMLASLVERFGERLLSGSAAFRGMARTVASRQPEMDMLRDSPDEYASAWSRIVSEGRATDEELRQLVHAIGAPTPEEVAEGNEIAERQAAEAAEDGPEETEQ